MHADAHSFYTKALAQHVIKVNFWIRDGGMWNEESPEAHLLLLPAHDSLAKLRRLGAD